MSNEVRRLEEYFIQWIGRTDPVLSCEVYKKEGCSHVDGFLCDFPSCSILKDYNNTLNASL